MVNDKQMKLSIYFSAAYSGSIKAGQYASVSIPSAMSEVGGTVSSVESSSHISSDGVKLVRVNITENYLASFEQEERIRNAQLLTKFD